MHSLITQSEPLPLDSLRRFVRERYGLDCTMETLAAEKDQLLRARTADGASYLLKVANPAETLAESSLQVNVLLHLAARAPDIPVQRVVHALDGEPWLRAGIPGAGGERNLRLVTFLSGVTLKHARRGPAQAVSLGRTWARFGAALADFDDAAVRGHAPRWDLARLGDIEPWIDDIGDAPARALAATGFARFGRDVEPVLAGLRAQPIHNDFSGDNVLVGEEAPEGAAGILDFGDMVHSQLVNDVAVGASEFLANGDAGFESSLAFVRGYAAETPLLASEAAILFDLMVCRLVLRVTVAEWRAKRFPENEPYIRRNTPGVWRQLERLLSMDRAQAQAAMAAAAAGAHVA